MADPTTARITVQLDRERGLTLDTRALLDAELRLRQLTGRPDLSALTLLDDLATRRRVGLTEIATLLWAAARREDPTLTEDTVFEALDVARLPGAIEALGKALVAYMTPANGAGEEG